MENLLREILKKCIFIGFKPIFEQLSAMRKHMPFKLRAVRWSIANKDEKN